MDSTGILFRFTSYGESHGSHIGGVLEGMPSGIYINEEFIARQLARRAGGGRFSTPRKEADSFTILSGVFEGHTTGMPIGFIVPNANVRSSDYSQIKDVFRPSHADFTYYYKYGIRDYRGGGRSSARESVVKVFAGSLACLLLNEFNIKILSGIIGIGDVITSRANFSEEDFLNAQNSEIYALDSDIEQAQKEQILQAKKEKDSVGAQALIVVKNAPIGLGEPLYYRLDQALCGNLAGLNAIKAVEIGDGFAFSKGRGSKLNDCMNKEGFISNHSGGMLGGISNGEDIVIKVHFKPTPSIFIEQQTINTLGNEEIIKIHGRHDPCVGVRGSIICESIVAMVLADMLLLNATRKLSNLKKIY